MIKLSSPYIDNEELNEIKKVLNSGFLVQGNIVEKFEEKIANYLKVKHAIAVSSGTAALHLSLMSLNIKENDEVIVPNFTFPATANVVELVGGITKLVDIKLDSLCIDVSQIEENITEKTKAIIPVHEFGQCADMDPIINLAKKYNLKVIEDAACALGSEYKGKKAGTIGTIGCFSFHPRKAITTGEGGIIVTNEDNIADKIRILRNHGLSYINGIPQFISPGFNYRMTNIQGAIGLAQMSKLEKINTKKIKLAKLYNNLLKLVKGLTLPVEKDYGKHIYQTYHIILDKNIDRDKIVAKLKEEKIETNFGAYAVNQQPYYKTKYNYKNNKFKNSILAYKQGLALPLHYNLTEFDVITIANKLKEIIIDTYL